MWSTTITSKSFCASLKRSIQIILFTQYGVCSVGHYSPKLCIWILRRVPLPYIVLCAVVSFSIKSIGGSWTLQSHSLWSPLLIRPQSSACHTCGHWSVVFCMFVCMYVFWGVDFRTPPLCAMYWLGAVKCSCLCYCHDMAMWPCLRVARLSPVVLVSFVLGCWLCKAQLMLIAAGIISFRLSLQFSIYRSAI